MKNRGHFWNREGEFQKKFRKFDSKSPIYRIGSFDERMEGIREEEEEEGEEGEEGRS